MTDVAAVAKQIEPEVRNLGFELVRVAMIGGTSDPTLQVMAERPDTRQLQLSWLALFFLIEMGRIWVLATLRERWTTRIIVLPDAPLVRSGPYRFMDHPNYVVVVAEILVLPLVFGLWRMALVFTLLNGALLAVRIHEENRALGR